MIISRAAAFVLVLASADPAPRPPPVAATVPAPSLAPKKAPLWQQQLDAKMLCSDNALLLTAHSFESLQSGGYCKLCKPFDESACELDWPFSDVPPCSAYDEMRNGIFAFYGRPFEKPEWRALFATKSWYVADAAFTEARLSDVAKKNVAFLKQAATEKRACTAD
jgi:hypothetical protein